MPTRSKSGGLHLNLFVQEWTPAAHLQVVLKSLAAQLGLDLKKVEIFPKQTELKNGRGGNCITAPYAGTTFNDKMCDQSGQKKTGAVMTIGEFLECRRGTACHTGDVRRAENAGGAQEKQEQG